MKRALITGVTGQDGRYLSAYLISLGYTVYGMVCGQNNVNEKLLIRSVPGIKIVHGDVRDMSSLVSALKISNPHEVYHLAGITHVGLSWEQPELVSEITGLGVLRMLEAIKIYTNSNMDRIKFYQASSSEMFGSSTESPQNENTPFHPRSPYGVAKVFGHNIAVNYRESYGAFVSCGILFNHESPLRGEEFVTRKITTGISKIKRGELDKIRLGNINARRDWGYAGDYVKAMHLMLQEDSPEDYVIATGKSYSVINFLELAFQESGLGEWQNFIIHDEIFDRPADVDILLGDASKAKRNLGWEPKVSFEELVSMMVRHDLENYNG